MIKYYSCETKLYSSGGSYSGIVDIKQIFKQCLTASAFCSYQSGGLQMKQREAFS